MVFNTNLIRFKIDLESFMYFVPGNQANQMVFIIKAIRFEFVLTMSMYFVPGDERSKINRLYNQRD